jgi:membrane-associated phospholipid phosphatase
MELTQRRTYRILYNIPLSNTKINCVQKMIIIKLLLFSLLVLTVSSTQQQEQCKNLNSNNILNRCLKESPPRTLTILSNTVLTWINPRMVGTTIAIIYVILPLFFFNNVRLRDIRQSQYKRFKNTCIALLNLLHRMCFSLVLNIALYLIFRQSRPCSCSTDGGITWNRIGSSYGLPSGDASCAGIIGAMIWDKKLFHRVFGKCFAVIIIVIVAMERVVLGYHSLGQVLLGSFIGISVHYWNTRSAQWTVYLDSFVQLVGGFLLLHLDPVVSYEPNDNNNLFSWYMYGVGFQLFVVMNLSAFFILQRKNWSKLKWTLHKSNEDFFVQGEDKEIFDQLMKQNTASDLILADQRDHIVTVESTELRLLGEVRWTLLSLVVLFLCNYFSVWITQEALYFRK